MKKILLTFALIGGIAWSGFAQTSTTAAPSTPASGGSKFSIGIEGGLPVGDDSEVFGKVIGGSIKYEVNTATNTFLTLSAGYNSYILKSKFSEPGERSSTGFVPLKAGIKCYTDGSFFVEGQLGIVFSTETGGGHAFVYSPGIGYSFSGGFEAGVRYEGWSNGGTSSQVGLRLGYRF